MNNFYPATGLADSIVGDLNTIDGTDLLDKDGSLVITNEYSYLYTLVETSGSDENVPDVIKPLTNAGDKRWHLVGIFNKLEGPINQLIYSNFPGGF